MRFLSTRSIAALALAAGVGSLAACQNSQPQAPVTTTTPQGQETTPAPANPDRPETALVRFVHAAPAGAEMDLYADDTRAFEGIAFKTVTPYQPMDGQRYTMRLRRAGTAATVDPLASNSEGLDDGDYYTVFALPGDNQQSAILRVVQDDFSRPGDGKARVRVVNAAQGVDELDVYASGRDGDLFDGVDESTVTDYDEIDPWTGTLEIRAEDNTTQPLASIAATSFEAGKVYTVIVVGQQRGTMRLEAFVIEDQMGVPASRRTMR